MKEKNNKTYKDLFMGNCHLMLGDCLEKMKDIADGSVDMVLCDLPFGTTDCKWDNVIPFDKLWAQYDRIVKSNGSVILFGSEPFSTIQRMSNIKHFKYDWIWEKATTTGFQHAKNMPLKNYEIISVFSYGSIGHKSQLGNRRMTYNPQGIILVNKESHNTKNKWGNIAGKRPSHKETFITEYENYPTMILKFKKDTDNYHPTQKPVSLLEYLIKTYSNEGELILDNCMGSGSTGVACINTNRKFIGIELDEKYYDISCDRIEEAIREKEQLLF
jgi:site-specific DNA-methyltransferase (adenine-specific)